MPREVGHVFRQEEVREGHLGLPGQEGLRRCRSPRGPRGAHEFAGRAWVQPGLLTSRKPSAAITGPGHKSGQRQGCLILGQHTSLEARWRHSHRPSLSWDPRRWPRSAEGLVCLWEAGRPTEPKAGAGVCVTQIRALPKQRRGCSPQMPRMVFSRLCKDRSGDLSK